MMVGHNTNPQGETYNVTLTSYGGMWDMHKRRQKQHEEYH